MCGIAGVFTVERPVDADLVAAVLRMLDSQVHRGPNDWGILLPDAASRDPAVRSLLEPRGWEHVQTYPGSASAPAAVLGSRRLSILDLSPEARMPLGSPDGRVWMTYNGEIYNFRQLRAELIARGTRFRTQGDTETLLNGYGAWRDAVVEHLRGMFAFAMLDASAPRGPRLLLARDRLGIKPLYWARHGGVFQIASEVRALVAGGLVPREPEPRGFHGFLVYGSRADALDHLPRRAGPPARPQPRRGRADVLAPAPRPILGAARTRVEAHRERGGRGRDQPAARRVGAPPP